MALRALLKRVLHATYLLEPHSDDGLARWGWFPALRPGDVFPVRRLLAAP